MTKIKLCGLTRLCDIEAANEISPDYIGFVFAQKSSRYLPPEKAAKLKALLAPSIKAVGVFVREDPAVVARLLESGVIDIAQLHGGEDEEYVGRLRALTQKPIWKAFRIRQLQDVIEAQRSTADNILLDSGAGTGAVFDWQLIRHIARPYFLAGGLDPENVGDAITSLHPYGVDVSSGIERNGLKEKQKMAEFVFAVRKKEGKL